MPDVNAFYGKISAEDLFEPVAGTTPRRHFKVIDGGAADPLDPDGGLQVCRAGWVQNRRWDLGRRRPARPMRGALGPRTATPLASAWLGRAARAGREHFQNYAATARAAHENPEWTDELVTSLRWRRRFAYHFQRPAHINVLEGVAYGTLVRDLAATRPGSRPIIITDSRVVLGASAKGRSSSGALNRPLRAALPYLLGGDLYPGGLHTSSAQNPADAPSRDRAVPEPSRERPAWLDDLERGSYARFDAVLGSSAVPRLLGRWVRLLLLLGGDVETNPGPRLRPARPRSASSGRTGR